jgi:hypothetical protein
MIGSLVRVPSVFHPWLYRTRPGTIVARSASEGRDLVPYLRFGLVWVALAMAGLPAAAEPAKAPPEPAAANPLQASPPESQRPTQPQKKGEPNVPTPPVPSVDRQEVLRETAELVHKLDSDEFYVRQQAAERLRELAARPELSRVLAAEFERILASTEASFEVRAQLAPLRRNLPQTPSPPFGEASIDEVARLIEQLEADRYATRLGATSRLEWLLGNPKLVTSILTRVKQRMTQPQLSPDAPQWLGAVYQRARGAWLLSDPAGWQLPPVAGQQIDRWVDELARSTAGGAAASARRAAESVRQELLDVLARDECLPRVKAALEARRASAAADGQSGIDELLELTRPAMVAEYWESRHHLGTQHLLVGVPSIGPGAIRPSHFDRIDDRTAHCVSGSNLTPGDYPVGVAIPHPNRPGALFQLVNLPTPRRRMGYDYYLKIDEGRRLAELCHRTLARMLREKKPLSGMEMAMFVQFDADDLSTFAGKFFNLVDDEPLRREEATPYDPFASPAGNPVPAIDRAASQSSRHGVLARLLVTQGNRRAVPGLLEALDAGRFLPPTGDAPYRLGWLAALAIAHRDPWPETDAWLARLLERKELLIEKSGNAPELAATAAAMLLKRHQQDPSLFGLESCVAEALTDAGLSGYRFRSEADRQKVRQWWNGQRPT